MSILLRKVIVVVALGVASVSFAQTGIQHAEVEIPPELSQKLDFARGLIEDQSVVDRIQASQQAEAIRLLDLARDSYSKALVSIKGTEFKQADSQINEALSSIGKARRLVPDTAGLIAQQRAGYEKKVDSVAALEKSYLSYLRRAKFQPSGSATESEDRVAHIINARMDSAKSFAKAEQWSKAMAEAEKVEQDMKFEMGRILGLMAVDLVKKFDSPAEEYAYEIDRNRTLLELIPVVISELQPSEDTKLTIDDLLEQNVAVMDLAKEYANLRDFSKALVNVYAGIGYLEVALTSAGLILPQASGVH